MSSLFSSLKKKKKPEEKPEMITFVGEKVPVLGEFASIAKFVRDASCRKPLREQEYSILWKGQGRHGSSYFQLLGMEIGARGPSRQMWRDNLVDTENFVVLLPCAESDESKWAYITIERSRYQIDDLLSVYDNKKNVLVVFQLPEEQETENEGNIHPVYEEWIQEWREKHNVTHFAACLKTERGMEAALEWVASHLTNPATKKQVKEQTLEVEGKSRSALHWLAELGKKMLVFGALSKAANAANN